MNEIERRFNAVAEIEADAADLHAIDRIVKSNDTSEGISLAEMDAINEAQKYSGKISLRVPRTLHKDLVLAAKNEGISLNQFILYKLAK